MLPADTALEVIADSLRTLIAARSRVSLERVSVRVHLEPGGFVPVVHLEGVPWPEGDAAARRLLSALGLPAAPP